jgi:hypothetical protein
MEGVLLNEADLRQADFTRSNLSSGWLPGADLRGSKLNSATARQTDFSCADLSGADCSGADLTKASLVGARLVRANLEGATLRGCYVYAVSAWNVRLDGADQTDLVITEPEDVHPDNPYEAERVPVPSGAHAISSLSGPPLSVDGLEVAQFLYVLLNNQRLRDVIDTITSKVALVLGRFTPERKAVLDALRDELRQCGYVPVVFDFERPASRDFTETISTLAHLARFVIADITDASSIPQELQAITPSLAVPVMPVLLDGTDGYAMFPDLLKYPWVLPIYRYTDQSDLLSSLHSQVIAPAEGKARELQLSRTIAGRSG